MRISQEGIIRLVEFFEVVKRRRSVRAFAPQGVEGEKMAQVLGAANAAPSAGNLQGYEIFRVTRETERVALARAALDQFFIAQAPVVLVFCANPARSAAKYRKRGARLYAVQDATIACTFAMLAATALGLGTVWVGAFDDAAVQGVLGRHDLLPVVILPIGYPAEKPEPTPRRSLADLVHD
ncbi:MAG: nitroreductase family protein [Acidobacteria bacterium]|nr:nitroreductase family protein [Acidobacteriota bacterium]